MTKRVLKTVFQLLAFVAAIVMLVWAAKVPLRPQNRESLEALRDAPLIYPVGLCLLALGTTVVNGLQFWVQLTPVRRLRVLDVQAVNAVATVLAYLFKISVLFRVLVHNRRDRVGLLTIGAWFAAVAAVMGCVLVPFAVAGAWRQKPDLVWGAVSLGSAIALCAVMLAISRYLAQEHHWIWFSKLVHRFPMPGIARRLLEKPDGPLDRAHEGVRMLADPRVLVCAVLLRLTDVTIQATRFYLAARVLNVPLGVDQAVLAGSVYFMIGAVYPAGQLGAREGGTAWLLRLVIPGFDLDRFIVVVLLVTATEMLTVLLAAAAGTAWLRPDRLLRSASKPAADQR